MIGNCKTHGSKMTGTYVFPLFHLSNSSKTCFVRSLNCSKENCRKKQVTLQRKGKIKFKSEVLHREMDLIKWPYKADGRP